MEATVEERHVEVDDVAILEWPRIGNTCTRRFARASVPDTHSAASGECDIPWQITSFTEVHTDLGNLW
jgi:hypothetical protein